MSKLQTSPSHLIVASESDVLFVCCSFINSIGTFIFLSCGPNGHNELSIANWMSQITDIIPSGHEMISHQSEQNQYGYPQLQHPSSQGEAEVDLMII